MTNKTLDTEQYNKIKLLLEKEIRHPALSYELNVNYLIFHSTDKKVFWKLSLLNDIQAIQKFDSFLLTNDGFAISFQIKSKKKIFDMIDNG